MRVLLFVLFITVVFSVSSSGQRKYSVVQKDTTGVSLKYKDPFWKKTIAPVTLFGLSAISWQKDTDVRSLRNRYVPNFKYRLDDYMQYAPGATAFALKLSGVKGRNKLGRSVITWGGGMLIMGGLVNSIKYSARVMPVYIEASLAATGILEVLAMSTVLSVSFLPVLGSISSPNSSST